MYTEVKHNGFIKGKLIIYTFSMQKELIKIYAVLSDCCITIYDDNCLLEKQK